MVLTEGFVQPSRKGARSRFQIPGFQIITKLSNSKLHLLKSSLFVNLGALPAFVAIMKGSPLHGSQ
jgi:hypothetical protein